MNSEKFGAAAPVDVSAEDLKITASLARLSSGEAELRAALPSFRDMLSYFAAMQAADNDEEAFGGPLSGLSSAGESASSAHFRPDAETPHAETLKNLTETMLDNSGERDSNFIVVPNVL